MRTKTNIYRIVKYLPVILISGIIFYSCGRQVSVSPPDAPPSNGYVYIDSYPRGFNINLDGKDRRRITPDSLTWLSTGTYTITLKKDLFKDSTFTVNVEEGKKKSIYINFSGNYSMMGKIYCLSKPQGAQIFINDSSTGKVTPSTLFNLLPGSYKISYRLKNYGDASTNVTVSSGSFLNINMTLVDTTLWGYYTTENSGIKSNDLTCIDVDKNDIVWVGTDKNGVLSFNGSEWGGDRVFPVLPDKHINCITVDKNNMKFFGTRRGFVTYDGNSLHMYGFKTSGLPEFNIESIGFDNDDNWYIGTRGGLTKSYLLNNNARVWLTYDSSKVPDYWVTSIFNDNSGNLWIGTHNQGIAKRNFNGNWERIFTLNSPLINNYIRAFGQEPSGNIWVGFGSGGVLAVYDGTTWQNIYVLPTNSQTSAIFIDKNNTKWVATNEGLIKFNQVSDAVNFNYDKTGVNLNDVTGIAQDSKSNLWISTYGGGLIEYKGNH